MVIDIDGYGLVGSGCHEIFWFVPIPMLNQTPLRLYPSSYNEKKIAGYYIDEAGWNT